MNAATEEITADVVLRQMAAALLQSRGFIRHARAKARSKTGCLSKIDMAMATYDYFRRAARKPGADE